MTTPTDYLRLTLAPATVTTASWTVGQLLRAVVETQSADGAVTLRLGNFLLEGRSELPLQAGQSLTLQVASTGSPTVLRVVPGAVSDDPKYSGGTAPGAKEAGPRRAMAGMPEGEQHREPLPKPQPGATAATDDAPVAGGTRVSRASQGEAVVVGTAAEIDGIDHALRQALPRQGEIQPLFDALAGLTRTPGSLPPALTTFANRLLSRLPHIQTLTAAGELKQAMLDSGQFLEARLVQGGAVPAQDLKAMLLQLQALLHDIPSVSTRGGVPENSPPSPDGVERTSIDGLQRRTDAALARLVVNQIDSLPRDALAAAPPLIIDLPLWWGDRPGVLRMRVEPDDSAYRESRDASEWAVWLSFEPGNLGPIHCRLQLRQERVSTTFWAERETTAALLQDNLDELKAGLQQEGLTPGHLRCQVGAPPLPTRASHRPILDEHA